LRRYRHGTSSDFVTIHASENVRQTGTITAMDVKTTDAGYLAQVGPRLDTFFRGAHVLLRPLGNTIYVLPPYCVTSEDLQTVYSAITAGVTVVA